MPVASKQITNFEENIAPLCEHTTKKPIKAFYDRFNAILSVFTGKEDVFHIMLLCKTLFMCSS